MRSYSLSAIGGLAVGSLDILAFTPTQYEAFGHVLLLGSAALIAVAANGLVKLATALEQWARSRATIRIINAQNRADLALIEAKSARDLEAAEKIVREVRDIKTVVEKNQQMIADQNDSTALIREIARQQGILATNQSSSVPASDEVATRRSTQTVLVVEDDPASLKAFTALLRQGHYGVMVARSIAEATDRLPLGVTSLLLDLRLADGPGETLLDHLDQVDAQVRVVVLSGLQDQARLDAVRGRVAALLAKPVADFDVVLAALDRDTQP